MDSINLNDSMTMSPFKLWKDHFSPHLCVGFLFLVVHSRLLLPPHWAGSGGALGSQLTPWTPRLFAWQAWHLAS